MRPGPSPDLSARSTTEVSGVPIEASWMSPVVFPSALPGASSGSLLVAEVRMTPTAGSHTSLTCQATWTGTRRWFGGHSVVGLSIRVREGGDVSRTWTDDVQTAVLPEASVAVKVTPVVPSG